jgi:hypothetical protein
MCSPELPLSTILLISNTSATVYSDENINVNGTTYIAASARLEMDGSYTEV